MSASPVPTRVRMGRIAEQAVERARLTVVPRLRRRTPRVPFVILLSMLLVAGVVGLLMFNTTMQQNSFTATSLERQVEDLTARKEALEMELQRLNNPQRVAEEAKALGMVEGPVAGYVDLRDGTVSGADLPPAGPESQFSIEEPPVTKPSVLDPAPRIRWTDPEPPKKTKKQKQRGDTGGASSERPGRTGSDGGERSRGDRSSR